MKHILATLVAGAACTLTAPACAQTYPNHPIKLLVGYPPGGAADSVARLVSASLAQKLGQPVVVENKPGAGSIVAGSVVANSPADGYTLLLTGSTLLTNFPAVRKMPFDPNVALDPLGLVSILPMVVVTRKEDGPQSLRDLVAQAKAMPEKFSFGTYGLGSPTHFAGELLNQAAGLHMVHVPFNGSAPNLTALMGGQIPVAFDTAVAARPLLAARKITAVATLSPSRLPLLPSVPTVAELGYGSATLETWIALLVRKGTAPDVQQKLTAALAEVARAPALQAQISGLGLIPTYEDPAAVKARIAKELPLMRAVAAKASIRVE